MADILCLLILQRAASSRPELHHAFAVLGTANRTGGGFHVGAERQSQVSSVVDCWHPEQIPSSCSLTFRGNCISGTAVPSANDATRSHVLHTKEEEHT